MKRLIFALMTLFALAGSASAQTVLSSQTCPGTGCVQISTQFQGTAGIQLVGTGTWTAVVEAANDDATWSPNPLTLYPVGSAAGVSSFTSANSGTVYTTSVAGINRIRVRLSSWTTGTATVYANVTPASFERNNLVPVDEQPQTAALNALTPTALSALTTSVNVKASAGNVYGVFALNGAASTCWVQFINSAGAGALGTGVVFSVPLPASTTQPVYVQPSPFALAQFSTGIAVGVSTTATGAVACGTAGAVVVFSK